MSALYAGAIRPALAAKSQSFSPAPLRARASPLIESIRRQQDLSVVIPGRA
jgi:hypothetical protein